MKLLFVMNAHIVGGAERHTFDLAEALGARGHLAPVFAMKSGRLPPPRGPILDEPAPRGSSAARVRDLARRIARDAPDLIVAVNERPAAAATMARFFSKRRTPIVLIWHSTLVRNRKEAALNLLHLPLFNRLEGVVFVSWTQRRFWRSRGLSPRREATILNGIDLERFSPGEVSRWRAATRQRLGWPEAALVIGLSAVMRPEKNHAQLVDGIAKLRAEGLDARALMVGDGPMRPAIEARAIDRGVTGAIAITGMQGDVRPFLAAFDIGVLCSTAIETLSLSALETIAMGVPVVLSDLGGAREIAGPANGEVYPPGDLARFCAALKRFRDPAARREAGAAARARAVERFDRHRMILNYETWFREIASEAGSPGP